MTEPRLTDFGICPRCECGGKERPCWYCGHDGGGFTVGHSHITSVQTVSGWFGQ